MDFVAARVASFMPRTAANGWRRAKTSLRKVVKSMQYREFHLDTTATRWVT
jgi:hypothetical protein